MIKLEQIHESFSEDEGYRKAFSEEDLIHRIALRVHRLRKKKGLSQAELAERLGTQQPAIARLEGGYENPGARRLANLAYALECRPEDLVSRQPPRSLTTGWKRGSDLDSEPESISVIEVRFRVSDTTGSGSHLDYALEV